MSAPPEDPGSARSLRSLLPRNNAKRTKPERRISAFGLGRQDDPPLPRRNVLRRGKTVLKRAVEGTGFAVKKSISVGEGLRWRTRFAFDEPSPDSETGRVVEGAAKLGDLKKSHTMEPTTRHERRNANKLKRSSETKSVTIDDNVVEIGTSPRPPIASDHISRTTPDMDSPAKAVPAEPSVEPPPSNPEKDEIQCADPIEPVTLGNHPPIVSDTPHTISNPLNHPILTNYSMLLNQPDARSSYRKNSVGSDPISDDGGVSYESHMARIYRTGFVERSVAAAVFNAARQRSMAKKPKPPPRPRHHIAHGSFCNPWDSALRDTSRNARSGPGSHTFFHKVAKDRRPPDEQLAGMLLLAARPDFEAATQALQEDKYALASHWLGHCSFIMQTRGLTLLSDPVWSGRLGPLGPKRLVPPPCNIDQLPDHIDVVVLSNSTYDCYDKHAVQQLAPRVETWLVPLGLKLLLMGNGVKDSAIVELDWWQEHRIKGTLFVCTPAQHYSVREEVLWCSWLVHAPHHRIFICGGTGYRSVISGVEDVDTYEWRAEFGGPSCPVFKEISRRYASVDTAFLPIGGFKPRVVMSAVQGDPIDMLFVHRDLRAKRTVAHRWGTFSCAEEGMLDPVRSLEAGILSSPVAETEFSYVRHGRLHVT